MARASYLSRRWLGDNSQNESSRRRPADPSPAGGGHEKAIGLAGSLDGGYESGVNLPSPVQPDRRAVLTFAAQVRPSDEILVDGTFVTIVRVRKAQGRKPKQGENLHLVTADAVLRRNSTDPVRVRRRGSSSNAEG